MISFFLQIYPGIFYFIIDIKSSISLKWNTNDWIICQLKLFCYNSFNPLWRQGRINLKTLYRRFASFSFLLSFIWFYSILKWSIQKKSSRLKVNIYLLYYKSHSFNKNFIPIEIRTFIFPRRMMTLKLEHFPVLHYRPDHMYRVSTRRG